MEFKETLEHLAEEAGVILEDVRPDPKAAAERDFRKTALRMYEMAKNHFRRNLVTEAGAGCWRTLKLPKVPDVFAPILYAIPAQLLAYHTAVLRGCNVDRPRNLAKSVTVE